MKESSKIMSIDSREIGKSGENIACRYLEGKGHRVLDRNFKVKSGELDIVTTKGGSIYFVEVKAALGTREYAMSLGPEEDVHKKKRERLARAIEVYLDKKRAYREYEWEFLVIAVVIDTQENTAYVKEISDVLTG